MIDGYHPLAPHKAKWLVYKIITLLQASIKSRVRALPLGDLLALSFEVSLEVRKKVREKEGSYHTPFYYMTRVHSYPLTKIIDDELQRRFENRYAEDN